MSQATQARKQLAADPRDFVRTAAAGDTNTLGESIAAGADVNSAVDYGETALIAAAAAGRANAVRLLLNSGADVDAKRGDGFNALIIAAFLGHEEVVRALLEYGADVAVRDRTGMTPHGWAVSKGHLGIASLLVAAERASALRESRVASPAPAAPLSTGPATSGEQGAPPETAALIFEAGTTTGSNGAGEEFDPDATLMVPAKPQAVGSAQTPRDGTGAEETSAAAPIVRAAQSRHDPAESYVDDRASSSYSLSRLILLALISGLTAGATFFTVNWMIPPARTEAQPATPPVITTPQPLPQDSPKPETPKEKTPERKAEKQGAAEHPTTSRGADRVAAPAHAGADKHTKGKPEISRPGQPMLISAQGESTSSERPVAERVALSAPRRQAPGPPLSAGGVGGDATTPPRARATPQRTQPLARARPAEPLTLPTQPAGATPKKVIRWP